MTFKVYFIKNNKKLQVKIEADSSTGAAYMTMGRFGNDIDIKKIVELRSETSDILDFLRGFRP